MTKRAVDNFELARWRELDASALLPLLADHVKKDSAFVPTKSPRSSRWHLIVGERHFELLCTDSRFFDTRDETGGAGAIDLAMHLRALTFLQAARLLRERGI